MNFRLATMNDLENLKWMYQDIVSNMQKNGLIIWNDVYPYECLEPDIINQKLFVLTKDLGGEIMVALSLDEMHRGTEHISWLSKEENVYYIDRLGVNPKFERQGLASRILEFSEMFAKENGVFCIRLFVVDTNAPAIALYQKNGFIKRDGSIEEKIDEHKSLVEYGFEKNLPKKF